MAITQGKAVVGERYLQDCREEERLLDPMLYILKDKKQESKYKFDLRDTIVKAQGIKAGEGILSEILVFLHPDIKPSLAEVSHLVEVNEG